MKKNVVIIKHKNNYAAISYSIRNNEGTFNQALYLTIAKSSFKCKYNITYNPSIPLFYYANTDHLFLSREKTSKKEQRISYLYKKNKIKKFLKKIKNVVPCEDEDGEWFVDLEECYK